MGVCGSLWESVGVCGSLWEFVGVCGRKGVEMVRIGVREYPVKVDWSPMYICIALIICYKETLD